MECLGADIMRTKSIKTTTKKKEEAGPLGQVLATTNCGVHFEIIFCVSRLLDLSFYQ